MFTIAWIIQRQVLRCVSFDVRYDSSSPGPTLSIPTSYSKSSPNYQTAPRTAHRRNPRTIGTLSGFCASACLQAHANTIAPVAKVVLNSSDYLSAIGSAMRSITNTMQSVFDYGVVFQSFYLKKGSQFACSSHSSLPP